MCGQCSKTESVQGIILSALGCQHGSSCGHLQTVLRPCHATVIVSTTTTLPLRSFTRSHAILGRPLPGQEPLQTVSIRVCQLAFATSCLALSAASSTSRACFSAVLQTVAAARTCAGATLVQQQQRVAQYRIAPKYLPKIKRFGLHANIVFYFRKMFSTHANI